jgi:hypothetical protein
MPGGINHIAEATTDLFDRGSFEILQKQAATIGSARVGDIPPVLFSLKSPDNLLAAVHWQPFARRCFFVIAPGSFGSSIYRQPAGQQQPASDNQKYQPLNTAPGRTHGPVGHKDGG